MEAKREARLRRAKKTRSQISVGILPRLTVFRTGVHVYAALHTPRGDKVLAVSSTVSSSIKSLCSGGKTSNKEAAKIVGEDIATKAIALGVSKVAFDRSGFAYHGRVKQLADAARSVGLQF
jgi:large subunit ribosomal protein L18